jgi:hypothetical protein
VGTLDRLLRAAGWQLTVLPTRAPTATAMAVSIREGGPEGGPTSEERALRSLLSPSDGLASAEPALRVASCAAPHRRGTSASTLPPRRSSSTTSRGPSSRCLRGCGTPSRTLVEPWTPDPYAGPELTAEVPECFRRHGVLLAERELESVSLVTLDRDDILAALDFGDSSGPELHTRWATSRYRRHTALV